MPARPAQPLPETVRDALSATDTPQQMATFDHPRGPETTIAVLADPHLSPTAHGSIKAYHRSEQRLATALADADRRNVDVTVIAGDLTKDGEWAEYELATRLLSGSPEPTIVVPGNHDVAYDGDRGPVPDGTAFAAWCGQSEFPRAQRVGEYQLLAIDSTRTDGTTKVGGAVDPTTRRWLTTLSDERDRRIAVCHHPLSPVPDPLDEALPEQSYQLDNARVVADELAAAGADLVLTGHVHWPYAGKYRGLNVVGIPSVSSFPPAYLLVRVTPAGTSVSLVPLAGQTGLTEAYELAAADDNRGKAIQNAVSTGYFDPLLDERAEANGTPSALGVR
ncbi:metallophosphoesterase family protein [Halovenus halobia]|uniref:metallophosphoesterase family protein n=1 Tax=Halovenus halobia TaxID=3396622 RepID=UPI003F57DAFA